MCLEEKIEGDTGWVGMNFSSDLWQKDRSKSEREALQDGGETSHDLGCGGDGTVKKTGDWAEGGRVEIKLSIFIGRKEDGQD